MLGQTILLVEDDREIGEMIRKYLEKNEFRVVWSPNGGEAVALAARERPDLAILDVMLPDASGFEVCRELRGMTSAPILFLSCRKEEEDKINGLNLGGDDYITKPFSPNELVARVKANLRRPRLVAEGEPNGMKVQVGPIAIDRLSRTVTVEGRTVVLSRKEFDLLSFLALSPEKTFTHEELFREIWGQECFNDSRTIIVHISNLRKKIEPDPANPRYVINVHGVGYKFVRGISET
ncbi:response regulator transcription factor [Paenibacillus mucilaginosus]|uniref:Winged helix family two component transcriptional regulator n=3 Tax=Paenibacillus mucilaginosus TaxID=61624 RepID=H6NDX9_9BACL|nr:response regulator transcription factor [Paenibacillus mucilaginosus]AEI45192.1 two component transcriptional regulator, winged helix family [Paenibacillus mucilaginosus KNP414]AFC32932.1 winged helix family two component transcriptional regulator [Paenibacillus mucilaginosus 3016]AFH65243.1 transcriptional regulator [Paenibacillus mucilaginosus K02]MCG7212917.1 response regulator transcription factor [Paenibacillus mucilaginosus]WDM26668.1 response regulator transcription factor [Paenibaci